MPSELFSRMEISIEMTCGYMLFASEWELTTAWLAIFLSFSLKLTPATTYHKKVIRFNAKGARKGTGRGDRNCISKHDYYLPLMARCMKPHGCVLYAVLRANSMASLSLRWKVINPNPRTISKLVVEVNCAKRECQKTSRDRLVRLAILSDSWP